MKKEKLRKFLIALIIIILSYGIPYLFTSFIVLDFNVINWTLHLRYNEIAFGTAIAVFAMIIYFNMFD